MLKVGDYVIINKKAYYGNNYHTELDNLFNKVARIIKSRRSDDNSVTYYTLDITKNCTFHFEFSERFLININNGI